ncbi:MAG: DUF2891 domain-containing protein [Acetobacteraceae bacterium]|nr:DUF2891 domain-containing protein [Acetobacteraceae bacterium]
MTAPLTSSQADRFATIALGHVEREYPNKPGHVLDGAADAATPAALHPVFHGSFDWHSCVHSYWLLARLMRRFPHAEFAGEIARLFDRKLVATKVRGECQYFERDSARGFERPYGWAWLLKLAAELSYLEGPWQQALAPLAEIVVQRFTAFLPIATYPVRTGSHGNTAFALRLAADYPGPTLRKLLADTAWRWYGADTDCPAWEEPGGDDFLSPSLVEAECMRRLHRPAFEDWFRQFLPNIAAGRPAVLFTPVEPSDRSDGKIAHLDGLNLSRAWCLQTLAPFGGERLREAADIHRAAALPFLAGLYMGEHWLATYAVLALDEIGETD